jgi:uncharacterized glyoxalase superfamily protein PhnB
LDLPDFVRQMFEAEEIERLPAQGGFHMEAKIGDSVIMMEICEDGKKFGEPAAICVFVPDVDAAYDQAMRAEATSINAPEGSPYDGVKDTFGNTWWIAHIARDTNKKAARSDPGGSFFPLVVWSINLRKSRLLRGSLRTLRLWPWRRARAASVALALRRAAP